MSGLLLGDEFLLTGLRSSASWLPVGRFSDVRLAGFPLADSPRFGSLASCWPILRCSAPRRPVSRPPDARISAVRGVCRKRAAGKLLNVAGLAVVRVFSALLPCCLLPGGLFPGLSAARLPAVRVRAARVACPKTRCRTCPSTDIPGAMNRLSPDNSEAMNLPRLYRRGIRTDPFAVFRRCRGELQT